MLEVKLGMYRDAYAAIYYDEAGKRHRRSLGTADRSLAQTRLEAIRAHLTSKAPAAELTTGAIFQAYLRDREEDDKSTTRMKDAWKRLEPSFEHIRPGDITKDTSTRYINSRREQKASDGTIWTELTYLRAALGFAVRSGWLQSAPYIKVPQKPAPKEHYLERDEAERLHAAAVMPHVKLFIRLARSSHAWEIRASPSASYNGQSGDRHKPRNPRPDFRRRAESAPKASIGDRTSPCR
jgi:Phage integrase SAM-like domain